MTYISGMEFMPETKSGYKGKGWTERTGKAGLKVNIGPIQPKGIIQTDHLKVNVLLSLHFCRMVKVPGQAF